MNLNVIVKNTKIVIKTKVDTRCNMPGKSRSIVSIVFIFETSIENALN